MTESWGRLGAPHGFGRAPIEAPAPAPAAAPAPTRQAAVADSFVQGGGAPLAARLAGPPHFVHLPRALSAGARGGAAWSALSASWQRLGPDPYVAGEGRFRSFSTLTQAAPGAPLALDPHHPLYQPVSVNAVNGGVERDFAPVAAEVLTHPLFRRVLELGLGLAGQAEATFGHPCRWHVEVQQFRVEARRHRTGQPTPEGIHRDGRDYVAMMLVGRTDAAGAASSLWGEDRRPLGELTLSDPSELLMVADRHLMHSVSPLVPAAHAELARRDMLILSFVNLSHPEPLTRYLRPTARAAPPPPAAAGASRGRARGPGRPPGPGSPPR